MKAGRIIRQLWFEFADAVTGKEPQCVPVVEIAIKSEKRLPDVATKSNAKVFQGRDAAMETQCRAWLTALGLHEGAQKITVAWKPRMRSTAGYAKWPSWAVELNPRLVEFDGQVERTLKHELAHLIAYARAKRRRIEPHGAEWRQACADLGIPDESARHTLPLPRIKQTRRFVYACPVCDFKVERVRKFKRATACLHCCRKHNGGRFDARFQFLLKRSA